MTKEPTKEQLERWEAFLNQVVIMETSPLLSTIESIYVRNIHEALGAAKEMLELLKGESR